MAVELSVQTVSVDKLREEFLPKLQGKVFHRTSEEAWIKIQEAGALSPNQDGRFGRTSTHSHESMGWHLNAVCLFDLRDKTPKQIDHGLSLYNFLGERHEAGEILYYIVVHPKNYQQLVTLNDLDENLRNQKMYIPAIESWHPGDLALSEAEVVYQLNLAGQEGLEPTTLGFGDRCSTN